MSACLQDFRDDLFVNPHRTTCQSPGSQHRTRGSHLSKKPVTARDADCDEDIDGNIFSVGLRFTSKNLSGLEFSC